MKTNIVQIGNSRGVRIPKTLLEQLQFEKSVEFQVLPEGLLLRPVHEKENDSLPRANWDEMFQTALAETNDDDSGEFADWNQNSLSEFDKSEW